MKTFKFKLDIYKQNSSVERSLNAAIVIYKPCNAFHERYSRMWCQHLNCVQLQSHVFHLRKRNLFSQLVGFQAVPEICKAIGKADRRLFFQYEKKGLRPRNFNKVTKKSKCFPLAQAGSKFIGGNSIEIGNRVNLYWKGRENEANFKILTVKKTTLGEFFLVVVADNIARSEIESETSKIAGIDFGLKVFLTISDGTKSKSPQLLKKSLTAFEKASCQHSLNLKGSANCEKAKKNLVRRYEDFVSRRDDWSGKQAQDLTNKDVLCLETLNVKGTQRFRGYKISDLAFKEFWQIIEGVAKKKYLPMLIGDRSHPSSQTCSNCGHILKELDWSTREGRCPSCQSLNGRARNATLDICAVGGATARVR